ncbi:hypothetical protein BON30_35845 [Cystobacter ferrugineus]|uniref:Uncharacterized protein n=1 Tax=Cystobacter ferrugineus TaxID=83449 RepID=A0A1L9B137_9BACT|nr:hypothetical protein BON30_35845 [Cystobacter ferrugineus]
MDLHPGIGVARIGRREAQVAYLWEQVNEKLFDSIALLRGSTVLGGRLAGSIIRLQEPLLGVSQGYIFQEETVVVLGFFRRGQCASSHAARRSVAVAHQREKGPNDTLTWSP